MMKHIVKRPPDAAYAFDSSRAVKCGFVYYKPSKISLQNNRKYWCELHRESRCHPRQLVLSESHNSYQEVSETIVLENVFKVLMNEGLIKGKFVFHVMTSKGKFALATDDSKETDSWVDTLNEELFGPPKSDIVYEFRVKVHKNYEESMPYGDYLLKVYSEEIRLFTPNGLIPTKFRCSVREIHKVKYHAVGSQEFHVTISIKSILTNNKPKDILLLSTTNASYVAKVIEYRKKHLASGDDSDLCHGPEFEDDQKQIVQRGIFDSLTESSGAASNSQEKQTLLFNSEPDAGTIFSRFSNFSNDKPRAQSLPRIYKMTINPSLDEDGNAWSESFTARAPKRKLVVKSKNHQLTLLRQSISSRPPATLPRAANINLDDSGEYASIDSTNGIPSDNFSWLNDEAAYDYVRRVPFNFKFLNPKSDSAKLTEVATQSLTEESDEESDEEGYVINSIDHDQNQTQYLRVLSANEDCPFTFMPNKQES